MAAVVFSPSIFAQQTPNEPASKDAAKKKSEVEIKANYMKSDLGDKHTTLLKGNVRCKHDDTLITSEQVDYDDNAKIATSPGVIKITNPECDINADKGMANFKKKVGVSEGNVLMQLKPKPEEANAKSDPNSIESFKQPTTITCNRMEYFYAKKIASAEGGVVFKQAKRTAFADKAVYDQNKELLTLMGNVHGIDKDDQTFSAPDKVIISLKKGDEWMEAPNASASFKVDLDEETKP
jgi:lipopolysaccharide assembly outer membrane protein LptD (OstA)